MHNIWIAKAHQLSTSLTKQWTSYPNHKGRWVWEDRQLSHVHKMRNHGDPCMPFHLCLVTWHHSDFCNWQHGNHPAQGQQSFSNLKPHYLHFNILNSFGKVFQTAHLDTSFGNQRQVLRPRFYLFWQKEVRTYFSFWRFRTQKSNNIC